MSGIHIPNILLAIPRNPVTAVGLPLALGYFGGFPASKAVNTAWYHVRSIKARLIEATNVIRVARTETV